MATLPKRLGRKAIYRSRWINLFADRVRFPSGKVIQKYHYVDHPRKSAVVVLTNGKNEIIMIRAPRYITQRMEWELPAGFINRKENAKEAAKREVFEETGYAARNLEQVFEYYTAYGLSNHITHVFIGKAGAKRVKKLNIDETNEVRWMSREKIKQMIAKNEIRDGVTLTPLFLYFGNYCKNP